MEAEQDAQEMQQPVEDIAEAVFAEVGMQSAELPVQPEEAQLELATVATQPDVATFYFATNDSSIRQEDFEKIIGHASYLMQNPDKSLRIIGHTDQSGSWEYNQWLARQRAEAVAKVLVEYGVQPTQIHIESQGEDKPIAGLEHAIADRRVELEYGSDTQLSEANSF